MSAQNPDKLFDSYDTTYDGVVNKAIAFSGLKVDFFVRVKAAYLKDILAAHFGNPSTVNLLDVGCGTGNYHPHWIDQVGSLQGVDISAKCIKRAAERNPNAAYAVYDGGRLPFADHSFDAAVSICVMHHIDPPERASFVAELYRVIRPNGIAVVFEHNPSNFLTRRAVSNCPFDEGVTLLPHHETEQLMQNARFDVYPSQFILLVPPIMQLLRRIDGFFSKLPLGAQYFTCGIATPTAGGPRTIGV
jgi:ubiquinone/menaquinone biosynthesis C-methylase UbiE